MYKICMVLVVLTTSLTAVPQTEIDTQKQENLFYPIAPTIELTEITNETK